MSYNFAVNVSLKLWEIIVFCKIYGNGSLFPTISLKEIQGWGMVEILSLLHKNFISWKFFG